MLIEYAIHFRAKRGSFPGDSPTPLLKAKCQSPSERHNVIISEHRNAGTSERQNVKTPERQNTGTPKRRNVRKNVSPFNALKRLCSLASPAIPENARVTVSTISTAGEFGNCGKYSREAQQLRQVRWAGAATASCVPRFISTYRSPCPIYPSMKACSFCGCLPGCQSFMIYFITLQGSFPQKNGVLIKILLRTRNNNRIIEINSTRKARKSIYLSKVEA